MRSNRGTALLCKTKGPIIDIGYWVDNFALNSCHHVDTGNEQDMNWLQVNPVTRLEQTNLKICKNYFAVVGAGKASEKF